MKFDKEIRIKIKKTFIFSCLFYLFIQLLTLLTPFIMGEIIDNYIPNKDYYGVTLGIVFFVSIPLISVVLQMLYNYFCITFARNLGNDISITIMKNLIYKNNQYFDENNSLELLAYSSK